jgi:hypothetical protein
MSLKIRTTTLNQTYSFPQITADFIAAIASHPPVFYGGFHSLRPSAVPITVDDFSEYQVCQFELTRIWLRNFSPVRGIEEKRMFQWGSYQSVGHSLPPGTFLLAAHSLGFKPIHYPTNLSRQYNFQILLLDVDRRTVRDFFRHSEQIVATESAIFEATPAVQEILAKRAVEDAKILKEAGL